MPQLPTYRIRTLRRTEATAKGYRHTLQVFDEHTQAELASCDLVGPAGTSELRIDTPAAERCRLTPNRRVLPTRFALTDATGRLLVQFDLEVARKLLTPVTRTALVLLDEHNVELARLVDASSHLAELLLGPSSGDWSFVRGGETIATLTRLPARERPAAGLRGWLVAALTVADRGIVSSGDAHVFSAPVALATVALFAELTDRGS